MLRSGLYNSARVGVRTFHTTPTNYSIVGSAKEVLQKANKKTGEVLASGMESAEKNAPKMTGEDSMAEGAKDALSKANKKTGEAIASGMETAEKKVPNLNENDHQKKVRENAKGYDNLQDKGSKAETEQNRPEDGM